METKYVPNPNKRGDDSDEKFRLSQKLVLYNEKDKTFLLVIEPIAHADLQEREYEPWNFPGGHLIAEEDPIIGLSREIREELGEDVKYGEAEVIDFLLQRSGYVVYLAPYLEGEIRLSDEHERYIWKTAEEIEKDEKFHPLLKQAIRSAEKRIREREYLNDAKRISCRHS